MRVVDSGLTTSRPLSSYLSEGLRGYDSAMASNRARSANAFQESQRAVTLKEIADKQTEAARDVDAKRVFNELSKGRDLTTPEGLKPILQGMADRGYGKEAQDLWAHVAKIYAQRQASTPAKVETEYDETGAAYIRDAAGNITYLKRDDQTPIKKYEAPKPSESPKEPQVYTERGMQPFQVVDGKYRQVEGAPIVPKEEKAQGLTASQNSQILQGIARRADDDKSIGIAARRAGFYNTAKTVYDDYTANPTAEAKAQTDQQLIYSLAKMRDEGVVMPGEFTRELMGQGWLSSALNKVSSGFTGGLNLSDSNRAYIVNLMKKYTDQAVKDARPRYDFYRKQGEKYGDPEFAVGQFSSLFGGVDGASKVAPSKSTSQSSGPKAGAIEDGYRFKGGDPADPNSWEKVK